MTASELFDPGPADIFRIQTKAQGPVGSLPLDAEMLLNEPSGNVFGLSQDAGMGWNPAELRGKKFLVLSTQGGLREPTGEPVALGFHTGHWESETSLRRAATFSHAAPRHPSGLSQSSEQQPRKFIAVPNEKAFWQAAGISNCMER